MKTDISSLIPQPDLSLAAAELKNLDITTSRFGLTLTAEEALDLARGRQESLKAAGRIELGEGIMKKLIRAFCTSPYVWREIWAETLYDLQEAFYLFKNEVGLAMTDDELISQMAKTFNGEARGSVEYLTGYGIWGRHD